MPTRRKSESAKVRTSFLIVKDFKERIDACLDQGRLAGALPMSCDSAAAFINGAIERELIRVEDAIDLARKKK